MDTLLAVAEKYSEYWVPEIIVFALVSAMVAALVASVKFGMFMTRAYDKRNAAGKKNKAIVAFKDKTSVLVGDEKSVEKEDYDFKCNLMRREVGLSILAESQGPLGLSKRGQVVADALNASAIVKDNLSEFKKKINFDNLKTPYDIQGACLYLAQSLDYTDILTEEQMNAAKDQAYQNDLFVSEIFFVIVIELIKELVSQHDAAKSIAKKMNAHIG